MHIHFSVAKYDSLLTWKVYINPGQGHPGEGYTPIEAIKDWVARTTTSMEMYKKGHISLGKFAELVGVSIDQAKDILRAHNIPLDMGVNSLEELQQDIENA